jgi:hypothetical protein
MASQALVMWKSNRATALDEFEEIHRMIGKAGAGTQHARQQVNQAYVLMVSGQFQGFCRDLHSEGVDHLAANLQPASLRAVVSIEFQFARKLDTGNPNSGNIGNDFNRFGLDFWHEVLTHEPKMKEHQSSLKTMNEWRNAIAHQKFDPAKLGGSTVLRHSQIKTWRKSCNSLAVAFDAVLSRYLTGITGTKPW